VESRRTVLTTLRSQATIRKDIYAEDDRTSTPPAQAALGNWVTEATHPAVPGILVHGTVAIEWLEG
jgi:hypothetical protein